MALRGIGGFEFGLPSVNNEWDIEYQEDSGTLPTVVAGRLLGNAIRKGSSGAGDFGLPGLGGVTSGPLPGATYAVNEAAYLRLYFKENAGSAAGTLLFWDGLVAGGGVNALRIMTTGTPRKLNVQSNVGSLPGDPQSSMTIVADTWYRLEIRMKPKSSPANNLELEVRLAVGDAEAYETVCNMTLTNWVGGGLEAQVRPFGNTVDFDDWKFTDDTVPSGMTADEPGACVGWPGPGASLLLNPTADVAVGSGWSWSAGGDLWAGLDNRPPSDADSAVGAITATTDYDFRCETPAAKGLSAGSVLSLTPVIIMRVAAGATSGQIGAKLHEPVGPEATFVLGNAGANAIAILEHPGAVMHGARGLDEAPVVRLRRIAGPTTQRVRAAGVYADWSPLPAPSSGLSMMVGG